MAKDEQRPWWEQPAAAPPYENGLDAKREHLRSELARAWRERREDHERRRAAGEGENSRTSRERPRRRTPAPLPPVPPRAA